MYCWVLCYRQAGLCRRPPFPCSDMVKQGSVHLRLSIEYRGGPALPAYLPACLRACLFLLPCACPVLPAPVPPWACCTFLCLSVPSSRNVHRPVLIRSSPLAPAPRSCTSSAPTHETANLHLDLHPLHPMHPASPSCFPTLCPSALDHYNYSFPSALLLSSRQCPSRACSRTSDVLWFSRPGQTP